MRKFPSLPIGVRGALLATHMSFRRARWPTLSTDVSRSVCWVLEFQLGCAKHVSVLEAMAMYEHLLNLDSVFCANLSFGLEDMLFRMMLSDEVCVLETFSRGNQSTSSTMGWMYTVFRVSQTPVLVCGTRCQGQSACMKGKRRHQACGPLNHSSGVACQLSLMFGV